MKPQIENDQLREALENLIYWAEQVSPDLPDTARVECLAYALDDARNLLKGEQ
jgi:hypothetical protein